MPNDKNLLWERSLEALKSRVNPQVYHTWFEPVRFIERSENTVVLGVPNRFYKTYLEDHHIGIITEALEAVCGAKIFLQLNVVAGAEEESQQKKPLFSFFAKKPLSQDETNLNAKYTFESFVVGPSNRFAHAAALAVSESPAKAYNPLFIYGRAGLGKTHLMQAVCHRILASKSSLKFIYITSEKFTNQLINAIQNRTTLKFRDMYRNVDLLLIDDIHFIAGKESTQEEFFHTFNELYDAHKQIIVSSDRSPKDIQALEERLVSRFEWGLVTDIQPPDFETRIAILRKKAEREGVVVPDDVTYFIGERISTNIRELEGALIRVAAYAKLIGQEITLSLVKEVLKDMLNEVGKKVSIDLIQQRVAEHFELRLSDMRAKRRTKMVVYPRQIAMYLARSLTEYSLPEIGEYFGGRDHSTILHACEKIQKDISSQPSIRDLINKITKDITTSQ